MTKELNIPVDNHADCVDKIVKVFDSCKTIAQYEGAQKFAMLWKKKAENEKINVKYFYALVGRVHEAECAAYHRVKMKENV